MLRNNDGKYIESHLSGLETTAKTVKFKIPEVFKETRRKAFAHELSDFVEAGCKSLLTLRSIFANNLCSIGSGKITEH